MAKVKVSIDQDKFDEFVKRAGIFVSKSYKRDIIADIEKGISPVQARGFFGRGGRYKKYSKSYREQIKEGRFSEFNKRPSRLLKLPVFITRVSLKRNSNARLHIFIFKLNVYQYFGE